MLKLFFILFLCAASLSAQSVSPATGAGSANAKSVPGPAAATQPAAPPKPLVPSVLTPPRLAAWESRAIAGLHQTGASSTPSTQNFFFDFFIMRGLGGGSPNVYDSKVNVWGNVRIASIAQQIDIPVAQFQFANQAANLKVNQLAQSGSFETGIGFMPWGPIRQGSRVRMLEGILSFGAVGSFGVHPTPIKVYAVPDAASAQRQLFQQRFPQVHSDFVAFTPPDRQRLYRQWWAGARITTFDRDQPFAPPSTYSIAVGQDETVTGGRWKGMVGKVDVFYPLPIGTPTGRWKFLFLFGTARLGLSRAVNSTPLVLQEVTATNPIHPNLNATPPQISVYDDRVSIIPIRTNRDIYRIGVGIDFVNLLTSWFGSTAPGSISGSMSSASPSFGSVLPGSLPGSTPNVLKNLKLPPTSSPVTSPDSAPGQP